MDSIHDEVKLIPWQESWEDSFQKEKQQITEALGAAGFAAEIYHVGSTSVKGMVSKPVIDILVCPNGNTELEAAAAALEEIGYANLGECGRLGRCFLSKGTEPNETFYLHLCHRDHPVAKDQLLFQALERSVPEVFQNYISIKETAAELFPDDRNAYREMKGWYIDGVLGAARASGEKGAGDDRVKYWIYELEMSEETNRVLEEQLALCEMTLDEFACAAVQNVIADPQGAKQLHEELKTHPEDGLDIRLVRYYPVYKGETEAQAKRRKLAEETAGKGRED